MRTRDVYDAIIVGARCAGSPLATLLARKGHRILLVDKARFPSDKPLSTHSLLRPGCAVLERLGLLDSVKASNCRESTAEENFEEAGEMAEENEGAPADSLKEVEIESETMDSGTVATEPKESSEQPSQVDPPQADATDVSESESESESAADAASDDTSSPPAVVQPPEPADEPPAQPKPAVVF